MTWSSSTSILPDGIQSSVIAKPFPEQEEGQDTLPARLAIGQLVEFRDSPGIGRVSQIFGSKVEVEFFESMADPVAGSAVVAATDCKRVTLPPETRVYRRNSDNGLWSAGRVRGGEAGRYFVRFPNQSYDLPVAEHELFVRWNRPVADPVQVLTSGGNETGFFANTRLPFLRKLLAQRSACASTTALLSSAVEIFPHQIETALAVLSDPVQRYLLTDEVGLGKTIEAGYIIRQTLIDSPRARVRVLSPDVLRAQWVEELTQKFFIDDFPDADIKVVAHEATERWNEHHDCDLLVVDEAHALVATEDPGSHPYRELAALAHSADRLLLLSATPVMGHRTNQLGMLHLLDPDLYRWSDWESFEQRHRLRSRLADSLNNLTADFAFLIPSAIAEIREIVPAEDERCTKLCNAITELLTEDGDVRPDTDFAELSARIEALRAHVSEAYRLHRRIIRHRRSTALRDDPESNFFPYEVRGREVPQHLVPRLPSHAAVQVALSAWRTQVWHHLLDHEQLEERNGYAMVLAVLASRATAHHGDFLDALTWRLNGDATAGYRAGLTREERDLLAAVPTVDVERDVLVELREEAEAFRDEAAILQQLIKALLPGLRGKCRALVFCGPGQLAVLLADQFRKRYPTLSVFEHTQRSGVDGSRQAVREWGAGGDATTPGRQCLLIADDSAEDGLNLQAADVVIHLRLPWSPNRLEQRLGRIDRYPDPSLPPSVGSGSVSQYRLGDPHAEDSLPEAWNTLLTDGYGVFADSVSTLQDAIAAGLVKAWSKGLVSGVEGLIGHVAAVREELREARAEIDKMDLLEAVHENESPQRDITAALQDLEQDWSGIERSLLNYVGDDGGVRIRSNRRIEAGVEQRFFDILHSQPLIDPRQWAGLRQQMRPAMLHGVFNRSVALRSPGTRLFRSGNPLVDALERMLSYDDRGQATAFCRIDPRHQGTPIPYFGFDFLVEADLKAARGFVGEHPFVVAALRRQADRILPPFTLRVWVECGTGEAVTDVGLISRLDRPYEKRRDENYNAGRYSGLLEVFGGAGHYRDVAMSAEQTARSYLKQTTELERRCEEARDQAQQNIAVLSAQAQARRAAGHLLSDTESLLTDVAISEALAEGLMDPTVKVISVTCIVLTARGGYADVGR